MAAFEGDQIERSMKFAEAGTLAPGNESVTSRLKRQLAQHHAEAKNIERLLGLLERNPDIDEILNLTRRVL